MNFFCFLFLFFFFPAGPASKCRQKSWRNTVDVGLSGHAIDASTPPCPCAVGAGLSMKTEISNFGKKRCKEAEPRERMQNAVKLTFGNGVGKKTKNKRETSYLDNKVLVFCCCSIPKSTKPHDRDPSKEPSNRPSSRCLRR